jgi:hypothetical protein
MWCIFPRVTQIKTKFANFVGLYFPHFVVKLCNFTTLTCSFSLFCRSKFSLYSSWNHLLNVVLLISRKVPFSYLLILDSCIGNKRTSCLLKIQWLAVCYSTRRRLAFCNLSSYSGCCKFKYEWLCYFLKACATSELFYFIYLFINFTINKTIEGTDNRTVESQIKSYLHITLTL